MLSQYLFRKIFFIFFLGLTANGFSQYITYRDTAKVSFSLFAKGGIVYDYPIYDNFSAPGPMGEAGVNINLKIVQFSIGLGYFPNNSTWYQGPDNFNPAKRGITQTGAMYMPLHANFKLFNLKRNMLSLKIGFILLASTKATVNETLLYTTYTTTNSYIYTLSRFGMAGTVGFKYSRLIGERFLIGAELGINFALVPTLLLGTNYTYGFNMINRHPNGDFKICFEYRLGKKHCNYYNETKTKPRVKRDRVVDEE